MYCIISRCYHIIRIPQNQNVLVAVWRGAEDTRPPLLLQDTTFINSFVETDGVRDTPSLPWQSTPPPPPGWWLDSLGKQSSYIRTAAAVGWCTLNCRKLFVSFLFIYFGVFFRLTPRPIRLPPPPPLLFSCLVFNVADRWRIYRSSWPKQWPKQWERLMPSRNIIRSTPIYSFSTFLSFSGVFRNSGVS